MSAFIVDLLPCNTSGETVLDGQWWVSIGDSTEPYQNR